MTNGVHTFSDADNEAPDRPRASVSRQCVNGGSFSAALVVPSSRFEKAFAPALPASFRPREEEERQAENPLSHLGVSSTCYSSPLRNN